MRVESPPSENTRPPPHPRSGLGRVVSSVRSLVSRKPAVHPPAPAKGTSRHITRTCGASERSSAQQSIDKVIRGFRARSKGNVEKDKENVPEWKVTRAAAVIPPPPHEPSTSLTTIPTSLHFPPPEVGQAWRSDHPTTNGVPEPTARVLETAVNADLRAALEQERKQVRTLLNEAEQLRRTHAKELEDVKSAVVEQVRARGESATNEARIDTFASTLDRVSEAQLKQAVEALNGQIADVVMNALDAAENLPPTTHSADIAIISANDQQNTLLLAAAKLSADDDNRALLVEGALNGVLVQQLHDIFFASQVALSVSDSTEDQRILDRLYQDILRTENYKVAQRWKSVTSAVAITSFDVVAWQRRAEESAARILVWLSAGLSRPSQSLEPARSALRDGVLRLYQDAHELALIVRRDYLSARMEVSVVAPDQTLESSRATLQWDDIQCKKGDQVLTTYAFGLEKTDEHGRTSLLVPKVVTEAILRHALSPVAH